MGFTGSRDGMTNNQISQFYKILLNYVHNKFEFHHGDCFGADDQAHEMVKSMCFEAMFVIHPPLNPSLRAYRTGYVHEPLPYLLRNRNIVTNTEFLIAAPKENNEITRSGTWSTIRFARKNNKKVYILER